MLLSPLQTGLIRSNYSKGVIFSQDLLKVHTLIVTKYW